ncbi:uncharacterized protein LAESUDRAFT_654616 [Laetiporus sulphureus 93-53]|uniref:Condensation domain-containing protein n=1 Tax=Laetiporus sulphureus 93-53 TaxID=1314785 RepID=A0A165DZW3_9APHY|nr:uncharacterized protein LAESUDRAFT_654616 [Laetiporus sulphureus 93-53]KZT05977.1 hypothetical protein LAESUDRAFT_654616 [Laetiporus sulphureus 93-53]
MAPWVLRDSTEHDGLTYTRPLGLSEMGYHWDSCFNGTTDLVWHYVTESHRPEHFDQANVVRTWIAMKQYHPLLGSRLEGWAQSPSNAVRMVVSERRLAELVPGELQFQEAATPDAVQCLIDDIIYGEQRSFPDLPVRVFILDRTDQPGLHHIIFNTAHLIADGVSHTVLCRTFFDILTSPPSQEVPDLEKRLAMVVACEDLNPASKLSVPRQRWRRAIASVIFALRRKRMQGGQPLPGKYNTGTYHTPSRKEDLRLRLTESSTANILDNCRRHGITLAAALPVLAQLAAARTLHIQHVLGKISDADWEQRRREPMHFFLPVNLRPYLDGDWRERGGFAQVFLSVNLFYCSLPFLPSQASAGGGSRISATSPSFSTLLSREHFLLRCDIVKKQMASYIAHPLFLEIVEAATKSSVARRKMIYEHWQAAIQGRKLTGEDVPVSVFADDLTYSLGLSSGGNYDSVQPSNYPLAPDHPLSSQTIQTSKSSTPDSQQIRQYETLHITSWETHLHVRPAYFYLGAVTTKKQLTLLLSWDANVYEHAFAERWLKGVEEALLWYLERS